MKNPRAFLRIFVVLFAFGGVNLLAMLGRSALANIRGIDAVHLVGTGMCFGGAIVAFVAYVRGRRSS